MGKDPRYSKTMTTYIVSTTDRQRRRRIDAETPGEALRKFIGSRCATMRLNSWAANGREWFYDASVKVGEGQFRMNRDAAKSIHAHVYLPDA